MYGLLKWAKKSIAIKQTTANKLAPARMNPQALSQFCSKEGRPVAAGNSCFCSAIDKSSATARHYMDAAHLVTHEIAFDRPHNVLPVGAWI
jgi:hypothetical protein